jgi:hypothetical protein
MRGRNERRHLAWVAAALAFGACSDASGPDAADEALLRDMAIMAADATLEDLAMWSTPFGFAAAPAPAPGLPGARSGWSGELSGTRSVTFYDADGVEQDEYDALTTERILISHEVMGEVAREDWSVSLHREREMEVSGLAGEETHRTWNGSGSEEVVSERVLDGGVRSYHALGEFMYEDVVVPIPGSTPRYPVSGTITRSITVHVTHPEGERTRTVEVVITFDGSSTATAVVNGEEMEIDLSAREGRWPLRRFRR